MSSLMGYMTIHSFTLASQVGCMERRVVRYMEFLVLLILYCECTYLNTPNESICICMIGVNLNRHTCNASIKVMAQINLTSDNKLISPQWEAIIIIFANVYLIFGMHLIGLTFSLNNTMWAFFIWG